jgi:hypothetical protein
VRCEVCVSVQSEAHMSVQLRARVSGVKTVQSATVSLLIQAWLAVLSSGVKLLSQ